MKISQYNPWAGLASYEDPAVAEHVLKFCGRDDDSYDVARLIQGNVFVTLYGKSGIGKTSLLNAGVFPELREGQFTPVSLRLGIRNERNPESYQKIIVAAVERTASEVRTFEVVPQQEDTSAPDFLWNYFARHRFYDNNEIQTFPVIVLDQFEEVFRYDIKEVESLLRQLDYLNDKDHTLGSCEIDSYPYRYEQNYRFVVSIREDDLYRLEDCLDNCYLPALKRCRYRLRSLSDKGASEVILTPGENLFYPNEQDQLVKKIIDTARFKDDNGISTNLLSLICNRIYSEYKKSGSKYITLSFIDSFLKGNPIEKFYNEATAGFSAKEKSYIEDHLVDSTGRRNSVSENDFLLHVPEGRKLIDGDTRILQRISDGCNSRIELIHDSFCEVLYKKSQNRRIKEKTKRKIRIYTIFLFFILISTLLLSGLRENRKLNNLLLVNLVESLLESNDVLKAAKSLKEEINIKRLNNDICDEIYKVYFRMKSNKSIAQFEGIDYRRSVYEIIPEKNLLVVGVHTNLYVWNYEKDEVLYNYRCSSYIEEIDVDVDCRFFLVKTGDDKLEVRSLTDFDLKHSDSKVNAATFNSSYPSEIMMLTSSFDLIRMNTNNFERIDSVSIMKFHSIDLTTELKNLMIAQGYDPYLDADISLYLEPNLYCSPTGGKMCINYDGIKNILIDFTDSNRVIGNYYSNKIVENMKWDSTENKIYTFFDNEVYSYDIPTGVDSLCSEFVTCSHIENNKVVTWDAEQIKVTDQNDSLISTYACSGVKHAMIDTTFIIAIRENDIQLFNIADLQNISNKYSYSDNFSQTSTSSTMVALKGYDRGKWRVDIIDIKKGNCIYPLFESEEGIYDISISPDEKYLVYTSQDTCINIRSIKDGNLCHSFTFDSPIVHYELRGVYLYTLTRDDFSITNINTTKNKYYNSKNDLIIRHFGVSSDGKLLACYMENADASMSGFNVFKKNVIYHCKQSTYSAKTDYIKFVDNNNVLYKSSDKRRETYILLQIDSGVRPIISNGYFLPCVNKELMIFKNSNNFFDQSIDVLDYNNKFIQKYRFKHINDITPIQSFDVSYDENLLFSSTLQQLCIWSLTSGELLYTIDFREEIKSMEVSKKGEYVLVQTRSSLYVVPYDLKSMISFINDLNLQ